MMKVVLLDSEVFLQKKSEIRVNICREVGYICYFGVIHSQSSSLTDKLNLTLICQAVEQSW